MQAPLPPHLCRLTPELLAADFKSAWATTETFFSCLKNEEAWLAPPEHGLRHPLIFYYGHPAVFYVNKLRLVNALPGPINENFETLFAIGVDENSWDDMSKNSGPWPAIKEVRAYRSQVFETVLKLLATDLRLSARGAGLEIVDTPAWAMTMAIEHERIHLETTSVLMRELDLKWLRSPEKFPALHPSHADFKGLAPQSGRDYPAAEWVEIPAGQVRIGKPAAWPIFGWDCEYGEARRSCGAFASARFLASNGEFFEFSEAGGYEDESLWTEEGWRWRQFRKRAQPRFWSVRDGRYFLRTTFEEIPLPWSWPAIVNFHEAKAFANWRARTENARVRLMTEAEHHMLRRAIDPRLALEPCYQSWFGGEGAEPSPLYAKANFNLRHGSESPVHCDQKESARLLCDVFGNVWQWCEDLFEPLDGFRKQKLYGDYSEPSFDGRHQLLLGGSFVSTGEQTSPWVRTNFRRHFYQHAGVRLVKEV